MWSGRKYFWSASRIQNAVHQALPLIWMEYKACRSNILCKVRGDVLRVKVKTRDNFHEHRGTTPRSQPKQLYSSLNPSHMLCHIVCLQHTTAQLQCFPSLFLSLDSCISIIGHLLPSFPTLSMEVPNECIFIKYSEFLDDSVILQNLSLKWFPNLRSCFDSLFEAAAQFPTAICALSAPLSFPGQIPPLLLITDTQKLFWNLLLCK